MLLGMLHHRKHPSLIAKAYALACVAKAEGIEFFYFTPKRIDMEEKAIRGLCYHNGRWEEEVFRFPDVVHNTGRFTRESILSKLRELRRKVPFTSRSVGNKWVLHQKLQKDQEFAPFLLPTEVVPGIGVIQRYLREYGEIIMKPAGGNQGRGVTLIQRQEARYLLREGRHFTACDEAQLTRHVEERLRLGTHIVQPYIQRKDPAGQTYDFRVHVQKGGNGKWKVVCLYPRIAPLMAVTTNFGYTTYLKPFLKQEFGSDCYKMSRNMSEFGLRLAQRMDRLYGEPFDELGIDLVLDGHGKIWLLEANWRPGAPPSFDLELHVVRNVVQYAKYLHSNPYNRS